MHEDDGTGRADKSCGVSCQTFEKPGAPAPGPPFLRYSLIDLEGQQGVAYDPAIALQVQSWSAGKHTDA